MQIFPKTFKTSQLISIKLLFNLLTKALILVVLLKLLKLLKLGFIKLGFIKLLPKTKSTKIIIPKALNKTTNMLFRV